MHLSNSLGLESPRRPYPELPWKRGHILLAAELMRPERDMQSRTYILHTWLAIRHHNQWPFYTYRRSLGNIGPGRGCASHRSARCAECRRASDGRVPGRKAQSREHLAKEHESTDRHQPRVEGICLSMPGEWWLKATRASSEFCANKQLQKKLLHHRAGPQYNYICQPIKSQSQPPRQAARDLRPRALSSVH